jgi:4-oxalmesaconate hydratase
MIIDCHGHFTTAPDAHENYWTELMESSGSLPSAPIISDDAIAEALTGNQLRVAAQRGIDLTLLSPKASAMGHHVPDGRIARAWSEAANDLVLRAADLFPEALAAVCQLPQYPGAEVGGLVDELTRCVEAGAVGVNINPDPSGGLWSSPAITDRYWYPLFEVMSELSIPGMIHVSGSCLENVHTLGAFYLHADTTVFMQMIMGDLFEEFPDLRIVIPHGGGAVPYHWGRFKGLAARLERPPIENLLENVYFDTAVYHQPGIDMLVEVVGLDNLLFSSEMLGAVRGADPKTGIDYDNTLHYLKSLLGESESLERVCAVNPRVVYPRLDA